MKTRTLILALVITVPALTIAACNGDNTQSDSGPQNEAGSDVNSNPDTAKTDAGNDGGSCSTGLSFDNTLVPGWPNSIPQP
jgi:hypothetical protein